MPEFELSSCSPFGTPLNDGWPGLRIRERVGREIASLALRRGCEDLLERLVKSSLELSLPRPRTWTGDDKVALYWVGQDQWFVEADDGAFPRLAHHLEQKLGQGSAVTDQGHAWSSLWLQGERSAQVLERLCPVDLHPDVFGSRSVARTTMVHMRVQIARVHSESGFSILTPSSSARSFRRAVRHAATSVCGPID